MKQIPLAIIIAFILVNLFVFWPHQPTEPVKTAGAMKITITELASEPTRALLDNVDTTNQGEVKTLSVPTLERQIGGTSNQDWANRIEAFIAEVNSPLKGYGQTFVDIALKYGYHPYTAVAIAQADTSMGNNLTTPFNIGNISNTDSCPTCGSHIKSWEQGIEEIYQTLSNRYLGKATKLCHLSRGGWQHCPEGSTINGGKFYASSKANWQRNATWAFSWLLDKPINNQIQIKL